MNWIKRKIEERKERERKWEEAFNKSQPPSILGQTVRFEINDDIEDDSILIVSNKKGVILWRKYFEAFSN